MYGRYVGGWVRNSVGCQRLMPLCTYNKFYMENSMTNMLIVSLVVLSADSYAHLQKIVLIYCGSVPPVFWWVAHENVQDSYKIYMNNMKTL